ncbi:hypothetical protein D3C77_491890 [compost metagenome]
MKKWASLAVAFILGVVVASSSGTVLAKVQSLVGQKVTGELKVIVNGKELADKGAVVNGRTNAPVRAIADAIGGEVVLSEDTVNITTSNVETPVSQQNQNPVIDGVYYTKNELLNKKKVLEESLEALEKSRVSQEAEAKKSQETYGSGTVAEVLLNSTLDNIQKKQTELDKVNEALKSIE